MKFGLRGIRQLMNGLDHPHRKFQTIHVAGTNGKGSTACMLAAMFTAAGYKTGLYTSPHLLDFRERIRINGKQISEANVTRLVRRLMGDAKKLRSTFFEVTTALAFQYFAEKKIDIAVVETGLGGRLDATNVITPLVSAITGIGLEHTEILGKTIEKITLEKAGIIKRNVPCVSGVDMPNARRILLDVCKNRGSTLVDSGAMKWKLRSSTLDGMVVDLRLRDCSIENLKIDLAGSFQVKNAVIAILAAQIAAKRMKTTLSEKNIRNGLSRVRRLTGFQGRLDVVKKHPLVIADVAHNPQAIQSLVGSLADAGFKKVDLVFGVLKDKDYASMIDALRTIVRKCYVVTPKTERARTGIELAEEFRFRFVHVSGVDSVSRGVQRAIESSDSTPIVITGSNFVVAEALAFLRGKKYLTINQ